MLDPTISPTPHRTPESTSPGQRDFKETEESYNNLSSQQKDDSEALPFGCQSSIFIDHFL